MQPENFFTCPKSSAQRQYEALRAFYAEGLTDKKAAERVGFSCLYFKKIRNEFKKQCMNNNIPEFFVTKKPGPK